jgi:hypothetical protein
MTGKHPAMGYKLRLRSRSGNLALCEKQAENNRKQPHYFNNIFSLFRNAHELFGLKEAGGNFLWLKQAVFVILSSSEKIMAFMRFICTCGHTAGGNYGYAI